MVASTAIDSAFFGSSQVSGLYLGTNKIWSFNNPGYVLLKPTSLSTNSTTATIGANGQVTASDGSYISINGLFSSSFENYIAHVFFKKTTGTGAGTIFRYVSGGSSEVSANYEYQVLQANGTTLSQSRTSGVTYGSCGWASSTEYVGLEIRMYAPNLSKISSWRSTMSYAPYYSFFDVSGILNTTSEYDGFQIVNADGNPYENVSVSVYGVRS